MWKTPREIIKFLTHACVLSYYLLLSHLFTSSSYHCFLSSLFLVVTSGILFPSFPLTQAKAIAVPPNRDDLSGPGSVETGREGIQRHVGFCMVVCPLSAGGLSACAFTGLALLADEWGISLGWLCLVVVSFCVRGLWEPKQHMKTTTRDWAKIARFPKPRLWYCLCS